jgi:glyoxylate/hydroxypyruvate reductase A
MSAFVFVTPTWAPEPWVKAMRKVAPHMDVRTFNEAGNLEDVTYAAAWLPPANVLKSYANLKVIFSLGAGVDAILSDPTLPQNLPIVRVSDPDLTNRMSEYIVMHVLMHHRQQGRVAQNQSRKIWDSFPTHAAKALTVGIMGLGVLGQDAAVKLKIMGFNVVGWSRSKKHIEGVKCFDESGRDQFLNETDILVSLLPATAGTDGIINRALIQKLSRRGPFGAPILINAGRGRQQNEQDILTCLDNGELYAASLDVFQQEPLPQSSAIWQHPKLMLTPHCAADSDPETICNYIWSQIENFESGKPLQNLVNLKRGY